MSEGTAVVFQVGDRVKFEYGGITDYGTVVEVGDSIYTDYGNVWAFWENTKMKQNAAREYLTLLSRKEQPNPMPKYYPHKYADVIKHWADGGEIQFKYQGSTNWETHASPKSFPYVDNPDLIWRIKPEVKSIRYRIALTKDNQVKVYHEEPTLDDAYGSDAFKDWLDPEWRSVEVEV